MKKVRFQKAQILCSDIPGTESLELPLRKDVKRRWYTQADYEYFASERNYCSFKIRKAGKDRLLESILPCGDDALLDTMTLRSKLFEWTELEICRGLEIKINRAHRYQRMEEQRRAIYAVLTSQARAKDNSMCASYWEMIRESSERHTASAKIFAREIAFADQKAVESELKPTLMKRKNSILRRLLTKRTSVVNA